MYLDVAQYLPKVINFIYDQVYKYISTIIRNTYYNILLIFLRLGRFKVIYYFTITVKIMYLTIIQPLPKATECIVSMVCPSVRWSTAKALHHGLSWTIQSRFEIRGCKNGPWPPTPMARSVVRVAGTHLIFDRPRSS